jgi:hypothetical protein
MLHREVHVFARLFQTMIYCTSQGHDIISCDLRFFDAASVCVLQLKKIDVRLFSEDFRLQLRVHNIKVYCSHCSMQTLVNTYSQSNVENASSNKIII